MGDVFITGRDPNASPSAGQGPTQYRECAVIDLGNGVGALLTVAAVRETSSVNGTTSSQQLLPADSTRIAVTIVNNDPAANLYIGLGGAAAVAGTNTVAPGASYVVPKGSVAGQITGIWDAGVTSTASITATAA